MREPLPFDKKNAEDFLEVSKRIQDALHKIQDDPKQKATMANVSALSGVHRNTLRARGWPKDELQKIIEERKEVEHAESASRVSKAKRDKAEKKALEVALTTSREEAAKWFHLYQQATEQNEEVKRQMSLLNDRISHLQEELREARSKSSGMDKTNVTTLTKKLRK